MKQSTILIAAIAVASIGTSPALAATASATASVDILQQIQITKTADLVFGSFVPDTDSDVDVSVAASAAAARDCGILTCADAISVSAATFEVVGDESLSADITVGPLSAINDGGGNTMAITLTASNATLAMTGSAVPLYVGGTLTVGANQTPGNYSGSFDVTAEYQ